ncbi:MAG: N-acetylmuramoyl-L-alanine amidase [Lachnospiraceae bacterium]|nr:N-acetylmuramoyl-L-alanine amidase [Lachnospiraceae bacterium]
MRRIKRWMAMLLAVIILLGTGYSDVAAAALQTDTKVTEEAAEVSGNAFMQEEEQPLQNEAVEEETESLQEEVTEAEAVLDTIHEYRKGTTTSSKAGLIIVLDPGLGGTDTGAQVNGIVEKTLNLKIAQYCKAELEQYTGVTVYLTRETDEVNPTLTERAQMAVDKKADLFIGIHNNSSTSTAPSGVNVYYPNENYNAQCSAVGKSVASAVESKLTDLGLSSGGIHYENSQNGTKFPDGSIADYYGVIRRCKENSIPAIIIKHAFVTNTEDVKKYLSSDKKLKKLGVADAAGVAEYYGISKGVGFTSVAAKSSSSIELQWQKQEGITGYCIYRSTASNGEFTEVATIASASTTSWTDTGLTPGATYYYKICTYTVSDTGTVYSAYSPIVAGVTGEQPKIASIKSKNSKALVISWDIMTNAAGYEIYRSTTKDGTYSLVGTVSGTTRLTYTDTTVKAGKLYYYKIRSWMQDGTNTVYSDYSEPVSGRTAKIPSKLKVKSKDSNTLSISWKAVKNVSGFILQRTDTPGGKYKKIATINDGTATSYEDTKIKAGVTYYYRIQSFNTNNDLKGYSGYSEAVSGKTLAKTSITQLYAKSATKMVVKWTKTADADGYVIYRSTEKNGTYTKVKTIKSANTTSYTDKELTPGTKYFYKIRTRKKVDGATHYGSDSKVRKAWTGKKAVITEVVGTTGTKIRITWDEVEGADSYIVYRSTSKKGKFKKIASVSLEKGTSYQDKKLKMTKKYFYKVEAKMKGYKAVGTSGKSSTASGYPMHVTTITSVAANADNQLQINWNPVKNVTGYRLYRSTQEDANYTLLATVSGSSKSSYVDTTATAGTVYYYKIVLINSYKGNTIYGGYSTAAAGVLLTAPKDVSVVSAAENQLDITWAEVTGALGYTVYRSMEFAGNYTPIGTTVSGSETSYSDMTVTKDVTYYYKIAATGPNNSSSPFSAVATGCAVAKPIITGAVWNPEKTGITLTWQPSTVASGYEVYRSTYSAPSVQTKIATVNNAFHLDMDVNTAEVYYYRVRAYTIVTEDGKSKMVYGTFSDTVSTNSADYRIMGSPQVTVEQMATFYQASGKTYPAAVYADKGAANISAFCQIVYEECCIEGVKPEVLFAQICHETGYLQFGGQIKAEQCNFGGLGATDDGASGGVFADVRTGIRTQVQHLKAYASTDPLKETCIDSRFHYVTRGKAEYVQQLGKGNWATDTSYDIKLMSYINKMEKR